MNKDQVAEFMISYLNMHSEGIIQDAFDKIYLENSAFRHWAYEKVRELRFVIH